jgi:hypothetical protein
MSPDRLPVAGADPYDKGTRARRCRAPRRPMIILFASTSRAFSPNSLNDVGYSNGQIGSLAA